MESDMSCRNSSRGWHKQLNQSNFDGTKPQVLQELLKLRGNVNDRVRRHDAKYHIEKGTSLPLGKEGGGRTVSHSLFVGGMGVASNKLCNI